MRAIGRMELLVVSVKPPELDVIDPPLSGNGIDVPPEPAKSEVTRLIMVPPKLVVLPWCR
jgi:hypothetical protein